MLLLFVVIAGGVFALSASAAMARVDSSMLELGRHLIALSEAGMGNDARGVYLNGQSIGLRVFVTDHDMETTLDFYEAWCRGGAGQFVAQEQVLQEAPGFVSTGDARSWRDLTLRQNEDGVGFVSCLKHGVANASDSELAERFESFLETGNLHDLGKFHYAAVTRIDNRTRVVAAWTEGDFFPFKMFPDQGDAPGYDVPGIPRPPSGQRMLSAGELGHGESLTVYIDCEESTGTLEVFYRREFKRHGWHLLGEQDGDGHLFIVQRGNEMRVVSIGADDNSSHVTIAGAI